MENWKYRDRLRQADMRCVKHRLHRLAGHLRTTARQATALDTLESQCLLTGETQKEQREMLSMRLAKCEEWLNYLKQCVDYETQMLCYGEHSTPPEPPEGSIVHAFF